MLMHSAKYMKFRPKLFLASQAILLHGQIQSNYYNIRYETFMYFKLTTLLYGFFGRNQTTVRLASVPLRVQKQRSLHDDIDSNMDLICLMFVLDA